MHVPLTLVDFLDRAATVYGDRVAIVDEPEPPGGGLGQVTYAGLAAMARSLAAALDARGVPAGARVAIVAPNSARFLAALFGLAEPGSPFARAAKLPYLYATRDLKAIDDPASAHYNRIVDQSSGVQIDWTSCEDMRRNDERYAVGAVVAHNSEPPVPGAGSCIFLHVWADEGVPTAGCTAMSLADMSEIAGWLDGAAAPLLVQLPQAEYEGLREVWGLPALTG